MRGLSRSRYVVLLPVGFESPGVYEYQDKYPYHAKRSERGFLELYCVFKRKEYKKASLYRMSARAAY